MRIFGTIATIALSVCLIVSGCSKDDDNENNNSTTNPSDFSISSVLTNVSVTGAADGAINITVTGGKPWHTGAPYTYLWSNNATTEDITGLAGGIYSVTVTDSVSHKVSKSFTVTEPNGPQEYGCDGLLTMTDSRNGKEYKIIKIGNQCWMAENLDIGVMVEDNHFGATEHSHQTDNGIIEKYYYDNSGDTGWVSTGHYPWDSTSYGGLYEWDEMMEYGGSSDANPSGVQGICPNGWHIPSDAEFQQLTDFLGGDTISGGKLKDVGTAHWNSVNVGATNQSGFSAFAGGRRSATGGFAAFHEGACFWSSTINEATLGQYVYGLVLYREYAGLGNNDGRKKEGRSVRCVRD